MQEIYYGSTVHKSPRPLHDLFLIQILIQIFIKTFYKIFDNKRSFIWVLTFLFLNYELFMFIYKPIKYTSVN